MSLAQTATLPIVKIAAGAVIIFSTVGVGVMTGLIPGVSSQERPVQTEQMPAVQDQIKKTAPAADLVQPKPVAKRPIRIAAAQPARGEKAARPVCFDCGVVESVSAVDVKGEASGLGAVAGGVAGLVLGNQIGHGKGRTLAKVAGAAGGAYAGHQIEKNAKKTTQYEVAIRMDDGSRRTVTQASSDGLWAGSRVKVLGDTVVRNGG